MKPLLSLFLTLYIPLVLFSQSSEKKALDHSVYDNWNRLSHQTISQDGNWISFEINPQDGDGNLFLKNPSLKYENTFARGYKASIAPNNNFIAFHFKPEKDTLRTLKLDGKKDEDLPKDSLGIFVFEDKKLFTIPGVKSYKIPEKKSNWLAILMEENERRKKEPQAEETEKEEKTDSTETDKKEIKEKGSMLIIHNPISGASHEFKDVSSYSISENGKLVGFIREFGDTIDSVSVVAFNTINEEKTILLEDSGLAKNLNLDERGNQAAFLFSNDTLENHIYNLHYWNGSKKGSRLVADTNSKNIPKGWGPSEYGNIHFSQDGSKLYFGTAHIPEQPVEDTLLDEEKARVDVWNWKDDYLQPQQVKQLDKEKKRSYKAVYHIKKEEIVQLGDEKVRKVKLVNKGNAPFALGISEKKYGKYISWEVPGFKDLYLINLKTGEKTLAKEMQQYGYKLSPGAKYLMHYNAEDSMWYSYHVKSGKTIAVTGNIDYPLYEEEEDVPAESWAYGIMGWVEDDEFVLIYDRYDIWKIDPKGKKEPVNLTAGYGRKNSIRFKYQKLDPDKEFISEEDMIFLKGFNEETKQSGYFSMKVKEPVKPKQLIFQDYSFIGLKKAKKAGKFIWRKGNYQSYYDLWTSNKSFDNAQQISQTNPQISEYKWGSVELVSWTSNDGSELDGLLYLPENFDSTRKYPMISYFYEKYSDRMHRHYSPAPSASVINFPLYVSNDYILFMPDIKYREGHPGKSAYDAIISGTQHIVSKGFVDKNRIGIQGQSWGGYQVAYLVTQTDYFAAGMAGAPVSNMTSAYGGIRWGSGMSRMMQYEAGQSRIGGTLWEKPLLYIENSPIFHVENVTTPLLIMHNDGDGAVPWYQGIEMFVAMRRLSKPAWMLNYNDDEHNLMRRANRKDLSVRMMQFFDHYLKGKPMPVWMEEGIPAVKKGKKKGYELVGPKKETSTSPYSSSEK